MQSIIQQHLVAERLVYQGKKMVSRVQVQWPGLPKKFATWEELNAIHRRYPQAPAWGHAASLGGGIVTDFLKTEARRQKKQNRGTCIQVRQGQGRPMKHAGEAHVTGQRRGSVIWSLV